MRLQPGGAPAPEPDPAWEIGNYEWSEAFMWIAIVMAFIFGMFLFASYVYTRKKHIMLWSFAFLGIFWFYYELVGVGTYNWLVGDFNSTHMFGLPLQALTLLIPGLLAAGLCFDNSKKLGKIFIWILMVFTVLYVLLLCEPNTGAFGVWFNPEGTVENPLESKILANFLVLLVQVVSGGFIIALSVMKEGRLGPKSMMGTAGILIVTSNLLWSVLRIYDPMGTAAINTIAMIFPFFLILIVVCLVYGILGNKDWGFKLPNVDFEEL